MREVILIALFVSFSIFTILAKDKNFTDLSIANAEVSRLLKRAASLRITILVVLTNGTDLKNYKRALESLECYSKIHGYDYQLVDDLNFMDRCRQKDKFFRRHCISALFLVECDYLLFLDADMGVVNPKRLIEEFIDPKFDVTFYDRFFNAEIVAGSYLLKNSEVALDFIRDFSNYEAKLPKSFHGTDNGAVHAFVLSKIYPDRKEEYDICLKAYNASKNYGDLFVYETCVRSIMGISEEHQSYRFLRKASGWARDNWLTNSLWNPETDFMIHCWKTEEVRTYKKIDIPLKLTVNNRYTWYDPIIGEFDLDRCVPGNSSWNYDSNLIGPVDSIKKHLSQYRAAVQKKNFEHLAKLTQKIK